MEVWHEAVALADLVWGTTTLVGRSTAVATLLILVVGLRGGDMTHVVALHRTAQVVIVDGAVTAHVLLVTITLAASTGRTVAILLLVDLRGRWVTPALIATTLPWGVAHVLI